MNINRKRYYSDRMWFIKIFFFNYSNRRIGVANVIVIHGSTGVVLLNQVFYV